MAKDIDLKKGELTRHVNKAAKAIADGFIIIIPMESSYAFACDAFRADSVRAMHVLRGDPLFTAAQVIVGSVKTTEGITKLRGQFHEYKTQHGDVIPCFATYHPAYLMRSPGQKAQVWHDMLKIKLRLQGNT